MAANKKIFIGLGAGLIILLVIAYFGAKFTIGKIVKSPETRKEIESMIASGFYGVLRAPRATIGSVSMRGLSEFILGNLRIYDGPRVVYTSSRTDLHCSLIKQLLSGRCNADLMVDANEDGKIALQMVLLRSVLTGEVPLQNNLRGTGTLSDFNGYKLFSQYLPDKKAPLRIKGAVFDGNFDFSFDGQTHALPKVTFTGQIKALKLELTVRNRRSETVPAVPVNLSVDENGLKFVEPLKLGSFGLSLNYKGGIEFGKKISWRGDFSVTGNPMIASFFPRVLKCKTSPRNPANFSVEGPFSSPNCL